MAGVQLVVLLAGRDGRPDERDDDVVIDAAPGTVFAVVRGRLSALARGRDGARGREEVWGATGGADALLRFTVGGAEVHDDDVLGVPPLLRGAVLVPRPAVGPALRALPGGRGAGGSRSWTDGATDRARSPGPVGGAGGGPEGSGPAVTLVVSRGPGAGSRWVLGGGHHAVGRGAGAAVALEDPEVSRLHAVLRVRGSGVAVRDAGSANGTRWSEHEGDAAQDVGDAWRPLVRGGCLVVGSSVLRLEAPGPPAPASATGDGHLLIDPAPRGGAQRRRVVLDLPAPPVAPTPPRTPVAVVVVPLALAVVMALVWSPTALLFGLAAPVVVLATSWGERRAGRRTHAAALVEHARRTAVVRERCALALAQDLVVLRAAGPDPGVLAGEAAGRGPRLFSVGGPLVLRLGTGAVGAGVDVREDGATTEQVHPDAPVLLDLGAAGVLGVVGPPAAVRAQVASAVLGAAVLRSPHDLHVAVLPAPTGAEAPSPTSAGAPGRDPWGWVRWLPHALDAGTGAGTVDGQDGVLAALLALVRARREQDEGPPGRAGRRAHRPHVLVVVEGAAHARRTGGVAELLAHGPAVGVHAVCAGVDASSLPAECGAVLTLSGVGSTTARLVVHAAGGEHDERTTSGTSGTTGLGCSPAGATGGCDLLPDLVPGPAANEVARSLAPLRDATPRDRTASLPTSVRLVDVMAGAGLDATDPAALRAAWSRAPRCSRAVLGVQDVGGRPAPWGVDLVGDGPHALVAGTTGAGKSELLATLVTSLAVVNAPQELAFVLVDYKGGAAFADLVGLPHVVGLVTDLDAHLSGRALASLGAEVRRRERALAAALCRDHAEAVARRAGGDASVPVLPRLVVVVDEFRVLAEELPDLLGGLVRLAAVGRSLGIHLVLATQRPAGVVSADIRANTALRIALRVQDEGDSADVVDDVGAASLRAPGRALVRSGPGSLRTVQVARVALAPPPPTGPARTVLREAGRPGAVDDPDGPDGAGEQGSHDGPGAPADGSSPVEPSSPVDRSDRAGPSDRADPAPADVVAVVAAVRAAAAGLPLPRSPWLAPLPELVAMTPAGTVVVDGDRPDEGPRGTGAGHALVVGVVDLPEQQRRAPLALDPREGALLVVGAPRTGRSTALRAVLCAAAGAGNLHAHLVAAPSPALAGAEALGCVGAHVDPDDHERLLRLLRHLEALVLARRRGGADHAGVGTLLLLDDAERLLLPSSGAHHEDAADLVHRLLTDGPAVGVVCVLAGDRRVLAGRWGAAVGRRWLLAAADATDHVMAGVPARSVPRTMPPGRVLLEREGGWVVGQVGLLPAGPFVEPGSSTGTGSGATQQGGVGPAPAVPALPRHLTTAALRALVREQQQRPGPVSGTPAGPVSNGGDDPDGPDGLDGAGRVAVGVGGGGAGVVSLDLSAGSRWLVVGAPGSGRSTTLVAVATSARAAGRTVVVLAPPRSPLARWARDAGAPCPDADDAAAVARSLHGAALVAPAEGPGAPVPGTGGDGARDGGAGDGSAVVVLVDDVGHVAGRPGEDALLAALEGRSPVAVVAAGDGDDVLGAFRGLVVALRRSRRALLLHPVPPGAGEVAGVRLVPPPPGPPGRAVLVASGRTGAVQIACAPSRGPV